MSLSVLSSSSSIMQLMSCEGHVNEYLYTHCLNIGAKRQLAVSALVVVLKRFNLENGQTVKEKE